MIRCRNGYPTKTSIIKAVEALDIHICSIDNMRVIDKIRWQHHNIDGIVLLRNSIKEAGFVVSEIEPYKPNELRMGYFKINRKNS